MKGDKCSICDRMAIGYYATPSRGLNVCEGHAPGITSFKREYQTGWYEHFYLYAEE